MENPTTIAVDLSRHRESIVPVPVKSIEQQSVVFLHRFRAAWMKTRTSRLNLLRGILREVGVTIPEGANRVLPAVSSALSDPSAPVPEVLHPVLISAMAEVREMDEMIVGVKRQLEAVAGTVPLVEGLETIPGVGLLNATALAAMVGDFSRFRTGRRFASSLGLTPKEHSSGGRRRLGAISKRGDTYLRTLLIGGASPSVPSRRRTRKMRQMSSVRPTRAQADNSAGPQRPLFDDWLPVCPVCGVHPGPEPTPAPTKEAVDTCAVATPRSSPSRPFRPGKHPDDRELVFS